MKQLNISMPQVYSLAKQLSVCSRTKQLWARVPLENFISLCGGATCAKFQCDISQVSKCSLDSYNSQPKNFRVFNSSILERIVYRWLQQATAAVGWVLKVKCSSNSCRSQLQQLTGFKKLSAAPTATVVKRYLVKTYREYNIFAYLSYLAGIQNRARLNYYKN